VFRHTKRKLDFSDAIYQEQASNNNKGSRKGSKDHL